MSDLITETHRVPLPSDEVIQVHMVSPAQSQSVPAVIVIHDILGFNADTRRICERLSTGPMPLVVAAPDLYQGLGPKPICVIKTLTALKRKEGVTFERLRVLHSWLAARPDVDSKRIAVIGFCMGGGFALLYGNEAEISVVAPFYGDVPTDASDLENICPVVGGYGELDAVFAPQGHRLKSHLESLSIPHDVAFYPDAGHSYMNQLTGAAKLGRFSPMRAAYNEAAAEDSWRRIFDFFSKHL